MQQWRLRAPPEPPAATPTTQQSRHFRWRLPWLFWRFQAETLTELRCCSNVASFAKSFHEKLGRFATEHLGGVSDLQNNHMHAFDPQISVMIRFPLFAMKLTSQPSRLTPHSSFHTQTSVDARDKNQKTDARRRKLLWKSAPDKHVRC